MLNSNPHNNIGREAHGQFLGARNGKPLNSGETLEPHVEESAGGYCYRYPHPAVTSDCVIFGFDGKQLKVLLIERGVEPYKGMWALPGGFMKIDETIEQCAARELMEETNLNNVYLEQFRVFSTVDRDPRERVITVAFLALVRPADYKLCAGDDASNALWFDVESLPPMAFDHEDIMHQARGYLAEMLRIKPLAFRLLNETFSLSELQRVYEAITNHCYDRRNFQRKAVQSGLVVEADMAEAENEEENEERSIAAKSSKSSGCMQEAAPMFMPSAPAPEMECNCSAPESTRRHRRGMKLFRFNKKKKSREEGDGSTKDLFGF